MLTDLPFDIFILMLRVIFIFLLYFFLYQVVRVISRELQTPPSAPARQPTAVTPGSSTGPAPPVMTVVDAAQSSVPVGTVFSLQSNTSIGRVEGNTVVIPDAFVSSRHARLAQTNGRWYLTDLGSTNGTFVNGQRLGQNAELVKDGDIIQFGRIRLRLNVY